MMHHPGACLDVIVLQGGMLCVLDYRGYVAEESMPSSRDDRRDVR